MPRATSTPLFDGITSGTFDDPEFKEDAVREEVIAPMLRKLGYSPSGPNRIVRSRALVHPFVMIGSQKRRVNIVPDYLLLVDERVALVLDAKGPSEPLLDSHHAEQAYSYAIHPEVRAPLYALCNGRRLVVWDREHFNPILDLAFADFEREWGRIERALAPDSLLMPFKRDFLPDLGMSLLKSGFANMSVFWGEFPISMVAKASDELYSVSTSLKAHDLENGALTEYLVTIDFGAQMFDAFIDSLPPSSRSRIADGLARQPYRVAFDGGDVPLVAVAAELGATTQGVFEEFVPFMVTEFAVAMRDPEATATWLVERMRT